MRLMVRQVIMAAEAMNVTVFPSTATCWHFDDIDGAVFPKVFKLRTGAGSVNVRLVRHAQQARTLAKQACTGGFQSVAHSWQDAKKRLRTARRRHDFFGVVKRLPRALATIRQLNRALNRK